MVERWLIRTESALMSGESAGCHWVSAALGPAPWVSHPPIGDPGHVLLQSTAEIQECKAKHTRSLEAKAWNWYTVPSATSHWQSKDLRSRKLAGAFAERVGSQGPDDMVIGRDKELRSYLQLTTSFKRGACEDLPAPRAGVISEGLSS